MGTKTALPSNPPRDTRRDAVHDLAVVAVVTLATFVLSVMFELREWMTEVTHPLEPYQIDELPLTFAVLALALAWFSWRRWRHADQELRLRVQMQSALGEREAQYRALFMENLAGNASASPDGEIQLCNPALARMLGLGHPDKLWGCNLAQFYADSALWVGHREALLRGEKVEVAQLDLIGIGGAPVKAIARMLPQRSVDGVRELHLYLADISQLQLMQRELAETLSENRRLSQKYLLVQEEERRNLARELHDELGQCLNAIKLDAVAIRDMSCSKQPEIEAGANAIIELSAHVYDAVRGIMQRLRPAALDALGLHDAVRHLVGQWQRRNAVVECRLETSGDLSDLGEVVNITVYRLVQECLTNVAKHAQARLVTVTLERTSEDMVRIAVCDDGCGMDLHAKRTGLGLVGLRERVEALRGRLRIESTPGGGLQLVASLPVGECSGIAKVE